MGNIRDSSCGKTSREHSRVPGDGTSNPSLRRLSASKSRKHPRCLCLKKVDGHTQTFSWETDGALRTASWTRRAGEFHSVGAESTLSQILEDQVPDKYYLTPKACVGILRRASLRGKALPESLRMALERQAGG